MDEFTKKGAIKVHLADNSGTLSNEEYMNFLRRLQSSEDADSSKGEFTKKEALKVDFPDNSGTLSNEEYMRLLRRLQPTKGTDSSKGE